MASFRVGKEVLRDVQSLPDNERIQFQEAVENLVRHLDEGQKPHDVPHIRRISDDRYELLWSESGRATFRLSGDNKQIIAIESLEKIPLQPVRNLPLDVADFTGREEELNRLRSLLLRVHDPQETAVVISAISGKAGVGKTALAIRSAHQLGTAFPDGQLYVNLRGADAQPLDPADALAELLRSLGVEGAALPETLDERIRLYRAQLAERRVLALLDNAATEAQVRPLLPASPGSAALVTSRSRLAGLEGARITNLDVLAPDQAVTLLSKIVGRERVEAELGAARVIVRECGYLPLAVRIAGARLAARPHWRLSKLADRLRDERSRLDELRIRDLEVRTSFTLSYEGLGQDEQRAFRLLGSLSAPDFPAWAIAALLDVEVARGEDSIDLLVDAQLLEVAMQTDNVGQTRYRLHDLLRVFARERLRAEEEQVDWHEAVERVLGAYLWLAARADGHLPDALLPGRLLDFGDYALRWTVDDTRLFQIVDQDPLGWLGAERTSLVSAVEQAHAVGLHGLGWRIANTLAVYFRLQVHWGDWKRTHEVALESARLAKERLGEAVILASLANLYGEQGHWDDAITYLDQASEIFRELGDRRKEADTLSRLGSIHREQGRWDDAVQRYDQALNIFRELGDRLGEAYTLTGLGYLHTEQNLLEDAVARYDQALTASRDLGDRLGEAYILSGLGTVYQRQNRWNDAIVRYDQAIAIFRKLGDRLAEAQTLRGIGSVYSYRGRWTDAINYFDQAGKIFRELGDRRGEAQTLISEGHLYDRQGRPDKAISQLQRSIETFIDLGDRLWQAYILTNLGMLYRELGRWEDAILHLNQALGIFEELGERRGEMRTRRALGMVYGSQGRWDDGLAQLKESLETFRQLGDRLWEGRTLHSLGFLYRDNGRWQDALRHYNEALSIFQEMGDRLGEAQILRSLGMMDRDKGHWQDAEAHFNAALSICREMGDRLGEAQILRSLGILYRDRGQWDQAQANFFEALTVARELEDRRGEAHALRGLGDIYYYRNRLDDAITRLTESLDISRSLGDRSGEAHSLRILGDVYYRQGLIDDALTLLERSLEIYGSLGDRRGEGRTLRSLGILYQKQGRLGEASASLAQALTIFQERRLVLWEARTLSSQGLLLAAQGDGTAAEAALRRANTISKHLDAPEAAELEAGFEQGLSSRDILTRGAREDHSAT